MGLSKGIATELEVVLTSIREKYVTLAAWAATCPGRLHIAGHSMGGGMGAMLAYLANLKSDPLGMSKPGRTVICAPHVQRAPSANVIVGFTVEGSGLPCVLHVQALCE